MMIEDSKIERCRVYRYIGGLSMDEVLQVYSRLCSGGSGGGGNRKGSIKQQAPRHPFLNYKSIRAAFAGCGMKGDENTDATSLDDDDAATVNEKRKCR
jgi:hypothetical protein